MAERRAYHAAVAAIWAAAIGNGVAIALVYEAIGAAIWAGRIIAFAVIYDAPVLVMVGLRAGVTALQLAAAIMLWWRRPPGVRFAQVALLASTVLIGFEIGAGLAPSSVPPGQRPLRVIAYAAYAAAASWLLQRVRAGR